MCEWVCVCFCVCWCLSLYMFLLIFLCMFVLSVASILATFVLSCFCLCFSEKIRVIYCYYFSKNPLKRKASVRGILSLGSQTSFSSN